MRTNGKRRPRSRLREADFSNRSWYHEPKKSSAPSPYQDDDSWDQERDADVVLLSPEEFKAKYKLSPSKKLKTEAGPHDQLNWKLVQDKAANMTHSQLLGALRDIQATLPYADAHDREDGGNRGGYYRDEASVYHAELKRRGAKTESFTPAMVDRTKTESSAVTPLDTRLTKAMRVVKGSCMEAGPFKPGDLVSGDGSQGVIHGCPKKLRITHVFDDVDSTNAFLAQNPDYGVLDDVGGQILVARNDDLGESRRLSETLTIDKLRKSVASHSAVKDGGKIVLDVQTANLLLTIYDALSPKNQATFEPMMNTRLGKLVDFAWKQVRGSKSESRKRKGLKEANPGLPEVQAGALYNDLLAALKAAGLPERLLWVPLQARAEFRSRAAQIVNQVLGPHVPGGSMVALPFDGESLPFFARRAIQIAQEHITGDYSADRILGKSESRKRKGLKESLYDPDTRKMPSELMANFETAKAHWIQTHGTEDGFHDAFRAHILDLQKSPGGRPEARDVLSKLKRPEVKEVATILRDLRRVGLKENTRAWKRALRECMKLWETSFWDFEEPFPQVSKVKIPPNIQSRYDAAIRTGMIADPTSFQQVWSAVGNREYVDALIHQAKKKQGSTQERTKKITEARYEHVVFAQGDDAIEPLEILDDQGPEAAIDYLAQWHMNANEREAEISDSTGAGSSDRTYAGTGNNKGYILTWNSGLGYIGLCYKLSESRKRSGSAKRLVEASLELLARIKDVAVSDGLTHQEALDHLRYIKRNILGDTTRHPTVDKIWLTVCPGTYSYFAACLAVERALRPPGMEAPDIGLTSWPESVSAKRKRALGLTEATCPQCGTDAPLMTDDARHSVAGSVGELPYPPGTCFCPTHGPLAVLSEANLTGKPKQLRSGEWGTVVSTENVNVGDSVTITTASGKSWEARIQKVIWRGNGVAICATSKSSGGSSGGSGGSKRGTWTGCHCGSREIDGETIPSSKNCRSCQFDAIDQ